MNAVARCVKGARMDLLERIAECVAVWLGFACAAWLWCQVAAVLLPGPLDTMIPLFCCRGNLPPPCPGR